MKNANLNRIFDSLRSSQPKHTIEFQAVAKLDNGTFKAVMSIDPAHTAADISEAIASQTDGRGRLIEGSIARRGNVAVAYVKANSVSKPLDANFHMVTASTAADNDGRIWSVVNADGGKRVVLEAGDDLEGIFQARVNARKTFLNPAQGAGISTASFVNGDFVRYVDTASGQTKFGIFANVDGVGRVVNTDGSDTSVTAAHVVSAVSRKSLPAALAGAIKDFEARATLSADKFKTIKDYLKKAFGDASGPMLDRLSKLHDKAA